MRLTPPRAAAGDGRAPAVAGSFYPSSEATLTRLVDGLCAAARTAGGAAPLPGRLVGILVPHAGLEYSGAVAAAAWLRVAEALDAGSSPVTLVLLGTVHRAWWLDGVGVWDGGAWTTPLGPVVVDAELALDVAGLGPPFTVDRSAHLDEHSLEVQLPFVRRLLPTARALPLAVAAGTGAAAIDAGIRLGARLSEVAAATPDRRIVLAVSTDMAHYPSAAVATRITDHLAPLIGALDAAGLADAEAEVSDWPLPGIACGMCGIAPAVLGLAALRAMGAGAGHLLAAATSADVGGPDDRTVGYLAVAFTD